MFKLFFAKKINKALMLLIVGGGIALGFQNCAPSDKKFSIQKNQKIGGDGGENNAAVVQLTVTEHPIPEKKLTTSFTLQLSDRKYLAGVLSDIFGPGSRQALNELILSKSDDLGGPCSEYAHTRKLVAGKPVNMDPAKICNPEDSTKLMIPPAQAVRQGLMVQICSRLVGPVDVSATLNYALGKIKPGSSASSLPLPDSANIASLHRLFYRERPLPSESLIESVRMMFQAPETPTVDEWKTAIYSYCVSSQWQVL